MGNYYLYRLGQFLAKIFPLGLSAALVRLLCDCHYAFSRADRQAVEENLKVVGRHEGPVPRSEVRTVFRNFGKYLLEFFTMSRYLDAAFVKAHVHLDNIAYIEEVFRRGKGGIIVSAHLGNWEMGGAVLPIMGYPLSVVALSHKDPRVNALFNAKREAFGAKVIQADGQVRCIIEHLHKNRFVAILAERDFGNNGVAMDFWQHNTMVPKGAAFFSMKTGAPIIPIFFLRTANDDFEVHVHPPIDPPVLPDGKISEQAITGHIRQYLTVIEREISQNPSQWLLFRRFWQS